MLLIAINKYSSNLGLENHNFVVIIVIIDSGKKPQLSIYFKIHIWKSVLSVTVGK